jgi:hypothetical protein
MRFLKGSRDIFLNRKAWNIFNKKHYTKAELQMVHVIEDEVQLKKKQPASSKL